MFLILLLSLTSSIYATDIYPTYIVIPQIVGGNEWTTSITLANLDHNNVDFHINFYDDLGHMQYVSTDKGYMTEYYGVLNSGNIFKISILNDEPTQGWGVISCVDACPAHIGGSVRLSRGGVTPTESVYSLGAISNSTKPDHYVIPIEDGSPTAIALVNPFPTIEYIRILFRDENGLEQYMDMEKDPGVHTSFMLSDLLPYSIGKAGVVEVSLSWWYTGRADGFYMLALRCLPSGSVVTVEPLVSR